MSDDNKKTPADAFLLGQIFEQVKGVAQSQIEMKKELVTIRKEQVRQGEEIVELKTKHKIAGALAGLFAGGITSAIVANWNKLFG